MISTGDIKTVLYWEIEKHPFFGKFPEISKENHDPVEEKEVKERIVILIPGGAGNGQLQLSFPRICIYVPKIKKNLGKNKSDYVANEERLTEIENKCIESFRSSIYGKYGEEVYLYKMEDIIIENDPGTWSNFINMRLRFEVVNTKL